METIVTVDQARRAAGFARTAAHALAERLEAEAAVVVCEERETFESACAVVISEPDHRPTGWLQREAGEWRIQLHGAAGIVGRLASGRYIAAVVRVVAVAALVAACDERPVVVAPVAPVVAAPVPVEEEPEPEAWRCVRSGECDPPVEEDQ